MAELLGFAIGDFITFVVVCLFGLFSIVSFALINWSICCSSSASDVSRSLRFCSFIAAASGLLMVLIDIAAVLFSVKSFSFDSATIDGIMINFVLPFCSFLLKLFIYFIFVGQFYALKYTDLIYKTSKRIIIAIYILITISIVCVLCVLVLEPLIVFSIGNTALLQQLYKYDFIVLNANELVLSSFIMLIFARKLVMAMKFEKVRYSSFNALTPANNGQVQFVDESDVNLSYGRRALMNSGNEQNTSEFLLNDHYLETKGKDGGIDEQLKIRKTSIVHVMIRLVILSVFCIFFVEVLFLTLLNERFIDISYTSTQYKIVRCVESFCGSMALFCVYLHFNGNFKTYECFCRSCHNCCLSTCAKCAAGSNKDNIVGSWNIEDEEDEDALHGSYRQMML